MSGTKFQISKRKIAAVASAVAVFAAVTVSAATLGGVQTDSVGANSNDVTSPVTKGVSLGWETTYNVKAGAYVVAGIELAPIAETEKIPAGAKVSVTLLAPDETSLGEYVSVDGAGHFTGPENFIPAHDIAGASVVINGGAVTAVASETD